MAERVLVRRVGVGALWEVPAMKLSGDMPGIDVALTFFAIYENAGA